MRSTAAKFILGAATAWPLVYIVAFMVGVAALVLSAPSGLPAWLPMAIFPVHLVSILMILGLTGYYIYHVVHNEGLDSTAKIIWALVLFKLSIFAMPIYWFLYVWRTQKGEGLVLDHAADVLAQDEKEREAAIQRQLEEFDRELSPAPAPVFRR